MQPLRSLRPSHLVPTLALGLLALPLTAALAQPAGAPPDPLEELLAKHRAARGGEEALRAPQTFRTKGSMEMQGMQIEMVVSKQRPTFLRQDLTTPAGTIITAYDGVSAWGLNPMMGQQRPGKMSDADTATAARQALFNDVLIDPKRARAKLSLGEVEDLGGEFGEAQQVVAKYPGGAEQTFWISTEDFLVRKSVGVSETDGVTTTVTSETLAYDTVGGIKVPAKQRVTNAMGTFDITWSESAFDVEIDPEIFYMPGQKATAGLALDAVLEKHFSARSGAGDAQSVVATGKLGFMGLQIPLKISLLKPNKAHLEADMAGSKMVLSYDGEQAWTVSPLQAITEPEALSAEAADLIELFGGFLWGILQGAQNDGWELEMTGVEKVARDETYAIVMRKGELERNAYLGGEDFLERRFSLAAEFMGSQQEIDALLADYQTMNGIQVPTNIELMSGGAPLATVQLEALEVNATVDESIFALPPKPAAEGE